MEFFKYFEFGIEDDKNFLYLIQNQFKIENLINGLSENRSTTSKKHNHDIEIKINTDHFKKIKEENKLNKHDFNNFTYDKQILNKSRNSEQINDNSVIQKSLENSKNYENHSTKKNNERLENNNKQYASTNSSFRTINGNNHLLNEEGNAFTILEKLKLNLKNFGRKSLLSLIKQFRCYDNGTKFINKYDFIKVIRDFRLNLTSSDIEKLFDYYVTDKKKILINFEDFVNVICSPLNEKRRSLLGKIYYDILFLGKDDNNIELEILKSIYNPYDNFFGNDADQVLIEFTDCIELYHFNYKKKRNNLISLEEFFEFYRFIGFLIDSDDNFLSLINGEYSKLREIKEKHIRNNVEKQKKLQEEEKRNADEMERIHNSSHNNFEHLESKASFYKDNQNSSIFSNENNFNSNKDENELKEGVSGDILRKKLENLNLNNNKKNQNNINIEIDKTNRSNTPIRTKDNNIF